MSASTALSAPLPLTGEQSARVDVALNGLSPEQLHWVSGYAAGLAAATAPGLAAVSQPASQADPANTLTILYGSQTGNGEGVARELATRAEAAGYTVRIASLAEYKPAHLKRERLLTFVISTHGEGDPPDDAELFHEFLLSKKAPKLGSAQFSVLALGDSSYVNFCQTGREFDARLVELGASRLAPLVECDVDYDDLAEQWVHSVLEKLPDVISAGASVPQLRAVAAAPRYDKNHPFAAEVLSNQKITGRGSGKDVRHIELSLEDSGLVYEPGDALAVHVENPPQLVEQLLEAAELGRDAAVRVGDEELPLFDALLREREITAVSRGFLEAWAGLSGSETLAAMLAPDNKAALVELIDSHQVIDIVRRFPAQADAQALVDSLRRLAPRSYSIASSLAANPEEVHLTVAAVRYDAYGSEHWGAASTHLADRVEEGATVNVFVETNSRFRLPADNSTDVIMIGPGTGVAPFRAFVEERTERGAAGRNWLFFGDRNFSSDFLYQLEWQRHLRDGNLERLDLAFSRDQQEKIYVQDRIREQGAELWRWIEGGAHLYVCGDAKHMAGDVDDALADVISAHKQVAHDDAVSLLKELRRSGRYQRDVY